MRVPKLSGPQLLVTAVCLIAVGSIVPTARQRWLDDRLEHAVSMAKVDEIRSLLRQGAKKRTGAGETDLLVWAAQVSSPPLLEDLLARGADPNAKRDGIPLLHFARGAEPTRILLAHGADIEGRDLQGRTALVDSVDDRDTEKAQVLIQSKASLSAGDQFGRTVLHLAIGVPTTRVGYPKPVNGVTGYALTDVSTQRYRIPVIESLLRAGVDPSAADLKGVTPLHLAIEIGAPEIARCLLSHGADPAAKDANGRTPEDLASSFPAKEKKVALSLFKPGELLKPSAQTSLSAAPASPPVHPVDIPF